MPIIESIAHEQLVGIVREIIDILYPGGDPEAEWDIDMLDQISDVLNAHGLVPTALMCERCGAEPGSTGDDDEFLCIQCRADREEEKQRDEN